jgi:predicted  nucleic acid-binding Zn-ribbon protein
VGVYVPIVKDLIIFACIPGLCFILKLWMDHVRLEERHKALEEKVNHNWANVKQALEHLTNEIDALKHDIKELLKLYNR